MLMPYCANPGPAGGAGVAAPAGHWSLITARTFFLAMPFHLRFRPDPGASPMVRARLPRRRRERRRPGDPSGMPPAAGGCQTHPLRISTASLRLCEVGDVYLDLRGPAENRDGYVDLVAVHHDFLDDSVEVGEGPVGDPHLVARGEGDVLGPLGLRLLGVEDARHLVRIQGGGIASSAHETPHARRAD